MNGVLRNIAGWLLILTIPTALANNILHEQRSLYSNLIVNKTGNVVCLLFSVRKDQRNQSCINTRKPQAMVFAYTKMSMSAVLLKPDPARILVVGLGGGTLPTAFAELFPTAEIDTIEIDPAVVELAEQYFGYKLSNRQRIHTQDARIWVRRAAMRKQTFDIIVLDAFNGEYIPEHLMTVEFFRQLNQLLSADGVLVSNTFSISALYDHESATYAQVFGDFINFQLPESANRVVLAPKGRVSDDDIRTRSKALTRRLRTYNVPLRRYAKQIIRQRKKSPDWDTTARTLTDQFSPANLLNER